MNRESTATAWRLAQCDMAAAVGLASELSLSPVMGKLLWNRGYRTREDALRFLRPSLDHLEDPDLLEGCHEAVQRISQAIAADEKIAIYGDYDVDGMSATALLYHFFKLINARVEHFLPRRIEEGYGLNAEVLRRLRLDGVSLVITVDCGMSATDEAALSRELGLDIIITDHHECETSLPDAVAVINPKRHDSRYPFRDLAGVGVAFKLAWALSRHFSGRRRVTSEFREFLLNAIGLVALGTISDVVPLTGENRVLVCNGLDALVNSRLPGVRALMTVAGITDSLTARDIAFRLAPRLNAAGRLNEPAAALELLVTDSSSRAAEIADDLEAKNRRRQAIERKILSAARKNLLKEVDIERDRVIVLAGEDWHLGVLGIVASRIAEEFYRPTLLLNLEGQTARGSARSIPPFHIFDALKSCEDLLLEFGGHAQAAGITVESAMIDELRKALEAAAGTLSGQDLTPSLAVDAEVSIREVTPALVGQLESLEPFGEQNPPPLLMARSVNIAGRSRRLGADGQHLSFYVRDGGASLRAIAFNHGSLQSRLETHSGQVSILFQSQVDTWRGTGEPELVVRDIRLE